MTFDGSNLSPPSQCTVRASCWCCFAFLGFPSAIVGLLSIYHR